MRTISGYFFLLLSFVGWGMFFSLPYLYVSAGETTVLTATLIAASETTFIFGIALLGKEIWEGIKYLFREYLNIFTLLQ